MAHSMFAATQEFYRVDKKIIIAALYVRNSDTTKMDTEVQKAQLEALLKYAKEHGFEVREHLIFKEAVSAIKVPYWERKELLRLWDESERGSFDVVLVTEMFRLARYASEQFAIIEHLKRYNVRVESTTEKFEDTAEGRLLMSIQGFLGEVEANKIAIRTSRGKHHRAKQALTGQGQPAYGYVWLDSKDYKKACYAISTRVFYDKEGREWTEVKVVEWVYDGCLSGMSLRQMAMQLTQMGVPTREGREVWGVTTLRKILTDRKYTGKAILNTDEGEIELNGLVPRIISDEAFERVQIQLARNAEMSPRNNKHPKDTLMRGLVYCGICKRRMHVKHYLNTQGRHTQQSVYKCFRNDGIDDSLHKHTISVACSILDEAAWEFAVLHIRNPQLFSQHIAKLEKDIPNLNHSDSLEESLATINQAIKNLYKLAEVADDTKALEERLIELQLKKRDLEKLHIGVLNTEEKQENLRLALERFKLWAESQRQFLDDPEYNPTFEDKLSAIYFLGIRAMVFPVEGNPKRIKLELMPPDIDRLLRSSCHDTTLGPAAGGIRMWPYESEADAIKDVLRLARGMTYKCAAAGTSYGGGKCVVIGDPKRDKTEARLRALGRFINRLNGLFLTGVDVGTTPEDMLVIRQETPYVVTVPEAWGGPSDGSQATAYGVVQGIRACLNEVYGSPGLKGRTIALQGIGAVGLHALKYLVEAGAIVTISDIDQERSMIVSAQYDTDVVSTQEIHSLRVDVYCPCALGNVLNDQTIPELRCKIICGSANNQLGDNHHGDVLQARGILYAPDYIVNAGGLLSNLDSLNPGGFNNQRAMEQVSRLYSSMENIIAISKEQNIPTYRAADVLAEQRIASIRHLKSLANGNERLKEG